MKKNEQNTNKELSMLRKRTNRSRWQKAVTVMAGVVLFCTVYALILPAATLTGDEADEAEGFYLEQEEDSSDDVMLEAAVEEEDEDLGTVEIEAEEAGDEGIEDAEFTEVEDEEEETTTIAAEEGEFEDPEATDESKEEEGETTEAAEGGEAGETTEASETTGGSESGSSEGGSGSIGGSGSGEIAVGSDDYVVIDLAEGANIEDYIDAPTEEESSEAIEGESEAETEGETLEVVEDEIPEEELEGETEVMVADEQAEYFVGNLRYVKKKDYKINVAVTEDAEIPVGAKLKVRELKKGTDEYNEHLEQAKAEVLDGTNKIEFARFFDISFELDGEEIEPAEDSAIDVTITYAKKVVVPEDGSKLAVHFTKEDGIEVLEATGAPETIIEAVERPVEEKETPSYAVTNASLSIASEDNEDAKAAVDEEKATAEAEKEEAAADEAGMFVDDEEEGELYRFSFTQSSFSVVGTVVTTTLTGTVMTEAGETYIVTVVADPEAGIPEDAKLTVEEITSGSKAFKNYYVEARLAADEKLDRGAVEAEYEEKIENGDAFAAKFFDISIFDEDGNKIQPAVPVSVDIELWDEMTVAADADIKTIHFEKNAAGEEKPVVIDADVRTSDVDESEKILDGVSFNANGFSVYAIIGEGEGGDNARMTVNFYHGDEVIATVYVKNSDDDDAELEQIIYVPGVGTMNNGELFKGWILDKADYTTDDVADKMDIEQIRAWAKEKANNDSIVEGQEYNFYAMIFKTFSVTYKDELGTTIHSEALIFSGDSTDYVINEPYTPIEQDAAFQGWYWTNSDSSITDAVVAKDGSVAPFANGTEVTIKDNITFTVNVPRGYWLSFVENGDGASYTPPQFIANGAVTEEPAVPTRAGYDFAGWFENAEGTGSQFTFGQQLTARTTLYAKWTPKPAANYTVIIWKQRVSDDKDAADADKTYDVEDVITLSGAVGSTVNVINQNGANVNTGRGNSVRNYRVNGTERAYTGFHAARYDQNVTIAAEGNTVVNVYYDRNLITMRFTTGGNYYILEDGSYVQTATHSGLFDAELDFVFPSIVYYRQYGQTTEVACMWNHGSNVSIGTLTFYGSYKLSAPAEVSETLTRTAAGNRPIYFYRQNSDGTWPGQNGYSNTNSVSGNSFTLRNKYAGFELYKWRANSFVAADNNQWNNATVDGTATFSTSLFIRFRRLQYPITYFDGTYFNGDGVVLKEATKAPLGESEEIYYEASVASYNEGGADYYTPTAPAGYTFGGWYVDPTCTSLYTFTTMPEGGITVYAKWVQTQYRVFLHPNVPTSDTSFDMGGQGTSFRVDYGDKIAGGNQIKGTRDDYDLIGWYTDEACTNAFNFDAFTLNDTTVTTEYDKTKSTETDKYGNPTEDTNKDALNNRFWITRELNLYAKWRSRLEGANGIDVVYDAGEGTNAPEDPLTYLDNTEATAGAASTPNDGTKQFLYWVVQKWNGEAYVDTDVTVYPGDLYTVYKASAKPLVTEWVNPNDEDDVIEITDPTPGTTAPDTTHTKIKTATYTVQVRAEYGDKDAPTPIHIDWYKNYVEGSEAHTPIFREMDLQINKAVPICEVPERDGYKFLGWARVPVDVSESTDTNPPTANVLDDEVVAGYMYLEYHEAEGTTAAYYTVKDGSNKRTTQVAADEETPYHDMYAVWQKVYKVTVKKIVESSLADDKTIGFSFAPVKNDNGVITSGEDYNFTLKDGEEHVAFDDLLKGVHFSVTETAVAGFDIGVTGVYTDDDGVEHTISNLGNGTDITIQGDTVITFTNTRQSKNVKIYKVDDSETPQPLAGVDFTFNGQTLTTGEDGYTDVVNLVLSADPYTLEETKPKDHYVGLTDTVPVTASVSGVTIPDGTANVSVSGPDNDGVYTIAVVNPRERYTVTAIKNVDGLEADKSKAFGFTATGLTAEEDAFTLADQQDKVYESIPYGATIKIVESDSDATGFDTTVKVGDANPVSGRTTGDLTVEGNMTITFTNKRNVQKVKVLKVETGTTTALSGAVFTLTKPDGTVVTGLTTNADGLLEIDGETLNEFVVNESPYRLKETQAPDGYKLREGDVTFTVSSTGVVGAEEEKDASGAPTGNYIITVENSAGAALPMTGGIGTMKLYTLGGIMILLSALMNTFICLRRRERRYYEN